MDKLSPTERSRVMSAVRGKDTTPELIVRRLLHSMGFRFRLHRKDLPGKPDIVLPKYHACIFVHGCFWHQHPRCKRASRPTSHTVFWNAKLQGNADRDKKNYRALKRLGWRVMVIWECQTKNPRTLQDKIFHFLEEQSGTGHVF
ncbi:very short patch repair endonuclease [Sideroxyarcus sp. TK5]